MDNGAQRENARPRPPENARPRPPQGQWFAQQQPSMKQIMAVMTERDAAIQERNLALSEKKSALAERDIAILQRDNAISERNKAMMDRENAIATLQLRQNAIKNGAKHIYHRHIENPPYNNSSDIHQFNEPVIPSSPPPKPKRAKEPKETTANKKPAKKKVKRERKEYEEGSRPKSTWKDQNLGLNQVEYDDSTMPVPVCSCTGVYRPCYKWGSGGWQSSCCTTTLSQYPLPPVPHKRHARIGGRKMSGGAFNKLLSRLAAEGHDLASPVDLKDNWAKHGTNRYITIK